MDMKLFFTVLSTVFLAELGDKTQLATLLFSADQENGKITVFLAAAMALVLAAGLGVLAGDLVSRWLHPRALHVVAGVGFVAVGVWTLVRA
ncbi:MAG: TMEM165/GDT1 family protein [Deltaproteobacteria bacterium]|nr:TMEM165/GDT1 family protein [Deltaproteobacteria bacterium]MDH4122042.1 TMEM165/GDT1 family protein [Deltaproteobacteria bacterium]